METEKQQKASLKYLHIAPRKVQSVANLIKGLSVNEAEAQLLTNPRRPAAALLGLLRSAAANAKNNQQLNSERLFIKEIRVDKGPMLKRYMPRAMGRANLIQKKSSHVILVLAESEKAKPPRFKITRPERIKKHVAEKMKKQRKAEQKEKTREEEVREPKQTKGPGFIKKIFRRKSI